VAASRGSSLFFYRPLSERPFGWQRQKFRSGNAVVTKRSTKKLKTEMFDDLAVLQRKWQAAMRPGEPAPPL
jgi:hypothetical protein